MSGAFTPGELDRQALYMRQPPGAHEGRAGNVLHLLRPLYGLKQASRACYNKLQAELNKLGLYRSATDPCLFVGRGSSPAMVLVYVDDLLVAAASDAVTAAILKALAAVIDLRDEGEVGFYLGISIVRDVAAPVGRTAWPRAAHSGRQRPGAR